MTLLKNITDRIPYLRARSMDASSHEPLNKATFIELFFDLVFVFCIHNILTIVTHAEGNADWYSYYTFWFTFTLMLQIWFNSTIFMNRFGTGRVPDIIFLTTTMFLLIVMTQAISTGWEHYLIYNLCWVLIIANTIIHWFLRYRRIANPSPAIRRDTRMAIITLAIQAALVLISHLMAKTPAQITCLVAMLLGFGFWWTGGKDDLDERNREHLIERCGLLMVLTFGETLVTFGGEIYAGIDLFVPILFFLLIVGMFLVYLNLIVNLVDPGRFESGRQYMALTAWLVFCVANVTAAFEMEAAGKTLMGISGDVYFTLSVLVFLLSFFLFSSFCRYSRPTAKWTVARVIACLFVLFQIVALNISPMFLIEHTSWSRETIASVFLLMSNAAMVIAVAAVYAVLTIDRIAVRRERRAQREAAAAEEAREGEDC